MIFKNILDMITYSLQHEFDKSFTTIAKEAQMNVETIIQINSGKKYYREYLAYPLREKDVYVNVAQITGELKSNDSISEIARRNNASFAFVKQLSKKFEHIERLPDSRKSFSLGELREIKRLLAASNLSLREISRRYGACLNVIMGINNGSIKRFKEDGEHYPLRRRMKAPVSTNRR